MGAKKDQKQALRAAFKAASPSSVFDFQAMKEGIVNIFPPYHESERIFSTRSENDLKEIDRYVLSCNTEFVTKNHPDFAPCIPDGLDFLSFSPPRELTPPRLRVYYDTLDGALRRLGVEVRQEEKNGKICQTVKVGHGGTAEDATLERLEQKSVLKKWGFNPLAIGMENTRDTVLRNLHAEPRPVLYMVSQRIRIAYHPSGNPDHLIELALEPVHYGRTFTDVFWHTYKLELEIKKGPEDMLSRQALLDAEQARLVQHFPGVLTPVYESSATPGMDALGKVSGDPSVRAAFDGLDTRPDWVFPEIGKRRALDENQPTVPFREKPAL
ncbi:MAG: hypothetical protein H6862_05570 [Rhodospirillales bacterium]|nr:hypothetical protein [Rhodospirillales bacterium]